MYEQECFLFILLEVFYIDSDSLALSRPIRMKDIKSYGFIAYPNEGYGFIANQNKE